MKPFFVFLDFEYNQKREPKCFLNLVCCSILDSRTKQVTSFWLYKDVDKQTELKEYLEEIHTSGGILVGYNVFMAEGKSVHTLGLDVSTLKWIDLYLEYRLLTNCNNEFHCGNQLVEGEVVTVYPAKNKWERTEEENEEEQTSKKTRHNLLACIYKLTGNILSSAHKDSMRDLILRDDVEELEKNKQAIIAYCESDIAYLPEVFQKLIQGLDTSYGEPHFDVSNYLKQALNRGCFSALTSKIEARGYPIHEEGLRNLVAKATEMTLEIHKKYYRHSGFVKYVAEKVTKKTIRHASRVIPESYSKNTLEAKRVLESEMAEGKWNYWPLTDSGEYSLSHSALEKVYNWRTPPKDASKEPLFFYYMFLTELKTFSSIMKKEGRDHLLDNGSIVDGEFRIFPSHGLFGSQTGRSQAKATTLIHLKSSWMRPLVRSFTRILGSADWSQQEILGMSILSRCENLKEAYKSGDVYLAFAKAQNLVPYDGTKDTHKKERNAQKPAILGMNYGMEEKSLARKMSQDTGEEVTPWEARKVINAYNEAYPELAEWKENVLYEYREKGYIQTPEGWTLFGDQTNDKSVTNFLVQATGAWMLREAVKLVEIKHAERLKNRVQILFTLHDAIYFEFNQNHTTAKQVDDTMKAIKMCMREASEIVLGAEGRLMRSDICAWGGKDTLREEMSSLDYYNWIYVEDKGKAQYGEYGHLLKIES